MHLQEWWSNMTFIKWMYRWTWLWVPWWFEVPWLAEDNADVTGPLLGTVYQMHYTLHQYSAQYAKYLQYLFCTSIWEKAHMQQPIPLIFPFTWALMEVSCTERHWSKRPMDWLGRDVEWVGETRGGRAEKSDVVMSTAHYKGKVSSFIIIIIKYFLLSRLREKL